MLYRVAASELKKGGISRRYSYTVVVMQFYPRYLGRDQVDEYLHCLAPERALFTEFKTLDRQLKDHNRAFDEVRYEARFQIGAEGQGALARLTELSHQRDVFLICQCQSLEKCHADLLLLVAKHGYLASVSTLRNSYPIFEARIRDGL